MIERNLEDKLTKVSGEASGMGASFFDCLGYRRRAPEKRIDPRRNAGRPWQKAYDGRVEEEVIPWLRKAGRACPWSERSAAIRINKHQANTIIYMKTHDDCPGEIRGLFFCISQFFGIF